MQHCFDLAIRAGKKVRSNPPVGAVVVAQDGCIIGSGYHRHYGGPHAEINALESVAEDDKEKLDLSTLYVSLEPCCIHSKTPPCTDAILKAGIRKVVVSALDPNPEMNGKGVEFLREQDIDVTSGVCKEKGDHLIRRFRVNILEKRPFVLVKWAESRDGFIGRENERISISNQYSNVYVHRLRSQVDAIMVGTNTAVVDNPLLTTRLFLGSNPLRIVMDNNERIPKTHHLISDDNPTLIVTGKADYAPCGKEILLHEGDIKSLLDNLYNKGICSLMLEGGKTMINYFKQENLVDEVVVIKSEELLFQGIRSPTIDGEMCDRKVLDSNELLTFRPYQAINS